jgi:hypothetical protein
VNASPALAVQVRGIEVCVPFGHRQSDGYTDSPYVGRRLRGQTRRLERPVVVALSLNKALSAAGGAIVVSTAETKEAIRSSGSTMAFPDRRHTRLEVREQQLSAQSQVQL